MEPTRPAVPCDHVALARGSFEALAELKTTWSNETGGGILATLEWPQMVDVGTGVERASSEAHGGSRIQRG